MFGDSPYGPIKTEMLDEMNRLISERLAELNANEDELHAKLHRGPRPSLIDLLQRGFHPKPRPCVEC